MGKKQKTDKVELLSSGSRVEVDSRLRLDFISCVEAVVIERPQPADPLVLDSFQFVTNITPTLSTTLVPSPSQLLLRGGDGVHQGPSEVAEGCVVPRASILEMFVEASIGVVPVQAGFLGLGPPCTDIRSAAHIDQLTELVHYGVHEPLVFVLLRGQQVDVPSVDGKVFLKVE